MKHIAIYILGLFILGMTACKDNSTEIDYNPNVMSSKDYIRAEDAIFEICNAFLKAINDTLVQQTGYSYIDKCDVAYRIADNSLNFSYGAENRPCEDGKDRRGVFNAVFSGEIFQEGVRADLATDSLFVEDMLVEAVMVIENLGLNQTGKPEYSLKVTSSNISLKDTTKVKGVEVTCDFILVWQEGSSTPEIHEDDIYLITGSSQGISSDNYEFSILVMDSLENDVECFWISRGLSRITVPVSKFPTGDIDYIEDDGCFNQVHFYFNENFFFDIID